jgi:hypothetical protein
LLLLQVLLLLVGAVGLDQQLLPPHLVAAGHRWLLKVLWDLEHYLLRRGQ